MRSSALSSTNISLNTNLIHYPPFFIITLFLCSIISCENGPVSTAHQAESLTNVTDTTIMSEEQLSRILTNLDPSFYEQTSYDSILFRSLGYFPKESSQLIGGNTHNILLNYNDDWSFVPESSGLDSMQIAQFYTDDQQLDNFENSNWMR